MDIYPLANNRGHNPDHDKTDKIQSAQMQEPSTVAAGHTYKPEGHKDKDNIPQSAVNPSVKHGIKRSVLHGIEIRLYHFPEEVKKKGPKTKTYLWYSRKLIPADEVL